MAEAGMVRIQAHTMFVATPQRTALKRWMEPTPEMAPAVTCVVETGRGNFVAGRMDSAAAVSAQKPLLGFSRVRRLPMVWMIRQPPLKVPSAIAAYADSMTHIGTRNSGMYFEEKRSPVMMPMVFCASLAP